ncbi:MAG: polynucleotide adenylyltransferase PcnB [Legionellaceae bacterium]|nr:polynucleotide adenylyltransferase PcnB [Legionellaceae bacterium]
MLRKSKVSKNIIDTKYIIPRSDHHVSKTDINVNALKVLNRLNSSGYKGYLVGGSVRDLLIRKIPKDFDVATDAKPTQIRSLFRNARIIGRRFKLAHILYHREIIEVATFRSDHTTNTNDHTNERGMLMQDNVYGTLEDDAWRRDFTINSLYYNIDDGSIIDFTGGFKDIDLKLIRIIGNPSSRYQEDPVRMLRAIRFSAKLNFTIAEETAKPIFELNHLIEHVSNSRLFDEMIKLYQCGVGESVQKLLIEYGLFKYLYPQTSKLLDSKHPVNALIILALESTDARIKEGKPVTPAFIYAILLWFPLLDKIDELREQDIDPLPAIEQAMSEVIIEQNKVITIPKRHTQIIREIWMLQYRFPKRAGKRAQNLLRHPRFRAAYDFLALRALAGDESMDLANWWTTFQDVDSKTQEKMSLEFSKR